MRWTLLVALATTGCSADGGDTTIDITHDVCAPLVLSAPTATPAQHAGIVAAIALWRDRGAPLLALAGAPTQATADAPTQHLEIRFERAGHAFHGLYDDEVGLVYVNASLADPGALAIVIAHELGHAFGLPHVRERTSLMNPGNLDQPPTSEDAAALVALWGGCARTPAPAPVVTR